MNHVNAMNDLSWMRSFEKVFSCKLKVDFSRLVFGLRCALFGAWVLFALSAQAQLTLINANGYSGLGIVPNANVIENGKLSLGFENQIPGVNNPSGLSANLGLGVMENLEATVRLATQDPRCNLLIAGQCPNGEMRDVSASLKYRIPQNWLSFLGKNTSIALGGTDVGRSSPQFSSQYLVATHKTGPLQWTLGAAKATAPEALLHGGFGGVEWRVNRWSQVAYDKIGSESWLHSSLYAHPLDDQTDFYITLHNHLNTSDLTQKTWVGLGVNLPLSEVRERGEASLPSNFKPKRKRLPHIKPFDLQDELIKNGFLKAKFGTRGSELFLWVDQENFQWNAMDAAGVALGVLASTYGDQSRRFVLTVGNRGLDVLSVSGNISCVKKWLEQLDACSSTLELKSGGSRADELKGIQWSFDTTDQLRPELVISPTLVSTLATEYGAFDMDLGVNVNPVIRLWKGGYLDVNAVLPMGVRTKNFNEGGPDYSQRLSQQVTRQVFHQVIEFEKVNTQAMATLGKIHQNYSGAGLETQTFAMSGKARFDWQAGDFKDKDLVGPDAERKYSLASIRYSMDNRYNASTELQGGRFWAGDMGVMLSERFWHGDTALNFYVQRSRQLDSSTLHTVGFELWIPLTPRFNPSFESINVRGTNRFAWTQTSRQGWSDSKINSNVGVLPQTGDTLMQLTNLDRNSDSYFERRRERLRQAYFDLRVEDRKTWVLD